MMEWLPSTTWVNLALLLVAALTAWIVLRFLMRVTARVVRLGCLAIFLAAGVLAALNWMA
jgi:hypothetical protein